MIVIYLNKMVLDLLTFGTLLSGILVITSKNPVIAVVFLISTFINAAGYLIMLGIGFIGISYIIVYIGAIAVLFLFVIMIINIKLTDILETGSQYTKNIPLAISIGSLFIYEIFTILPFTYNNIEGLSTLFNILTSFNSLFLNYDIININEFNTTFNPAIADIIFTNFLQIEAIGHSLYTYGAFWLIITSVILLLAMIAPIFISRKNN